MCSYKGREVGYGSIIEQCVHIRAGKWDMVVSLSNVFRYTILKHKDCISVVLN